MVKKCSKVCSTDQRFMQKRNTTYRIYTLVDYFKTITKLLVRNFNLYNANIVYVVLHFAQWKSKCKPAHAQTHETKKWY